MARPGVIFRKHFGNWKNVHRCFSRWIERGVWQRIFKHLSADADNEYVMIESTIMRVHQHAAGTRKKGAKIKSSGTAGAY